MKLGQDPYVVKHMLQAHGAEALRYDDPSCVIKDEKYYTTDGVLYVEYTDEDDCRMKMRWSDELKEWDFVEIIQPEISEVEKQALYWEDERHTWYNHAQELQRRLDEIVKWSDETLKRGLLHDAIAKLVKGEKP